MSERADDTTDLLFDFYVPPTTDSRKEDVYPIAIHDGRCYPKPGRVVHDLGELPSSTISTIGVDEQYDDVVDALSSRKWLITISQPNGKLAWCGP